MPTFRCLMNGRNFLVAIDGRERKYGFYQTVYVRSPNAKQAELDAAKLIRDSEIREHVKNRTDDTPMIYLDEIEEVKSVYSEDLGATGASWYTEKEWWEFWRWMRRSSTIKTVDWPPG